MNALPDEIQVFGHRFVLDFKSGEMYKYVNVDLGSCLNEIVIYNFEDVATEIWIDWYKVEIKSSIDNIDRYDIYQMLHLDLNTYIEDLLEYKDTVDPEPYLKSYLSHIKSRSHRILSAMTRFNQEFL